MLVFSRFLPLLIIIVDLVPENDVHWDTFLTYLLIVWHLVFHLQVSRTLQS